MGRRSGWRTRTDHSARNSKRVSEALTAGYIDHESKGERIESERRLEAFFARRREAWKSRRPEV